MRHAGAVIQEPTGVAPRDVDVRLIASAELSAVVRTELGSMLWESFPGDFTEDDWQHCLGGVHVVAFDGDRPVGHASVVSRVLYVGHQQYDGGYLEAVAVDAKFRGRGIGASVVSEAGEMIVQSFQIAALSTSAHGFYERLGWERWQGPAYVVAGRTWRRTEDEDDGILVLRAPGCPVTDLAVPIAVEERSGDDW